MPHRSISIVVMLSLTGTAFGQLSWRSQNPIFGEASAAVTWLAGSTASQEGETNDIASGNVWASASDQTIYGEGDAYVIVGVDFNSSTDVFVTITADPIRVYLPSPPNLQWITAGAGVSSGQLDFDVAFRRTAWWRIDYEATLVGVRSPSISSSIARSEVDFGTNIPGTAFVADLPNSGGSSTPAACAPGTLEEGALNRLILSFSAGSFVSVDVGGAEADADLVATIDLRFIECIADFYHGDPDLMDEEFHPDGIIDSLDFFAFNDAWSAADPDADLTGSSDPNDPDYGVPDSTVDSDDFFYYLDLFSAGCNLEFCD